MDQYYRWSAWPIILINSIGIDPSIHRLLCPAIPILLYVYSIRSLSSGEASYGARERG